MNLPRLTTTIRKGALGELKVIADLLEKGYDVYAPVVDDNGIDFIVSNGTDMRSVQVKSHDNRGPKYATSVEVNTRKCKKADVVAIPIKIMNCVCYVNSSIVNRSINIAFAKAISGQKEDRHWYKDYMEFPWEDLGRT